MHCSVKAGRSAQVSDVYTLQLMGYEDNNSHISKQRMFCMSCMHASIMKILWAIAATQWNHLPSYDLTASYCDPSHWLVSELITWPIADHVTSLWIWFSFQSSWSFVHEDEEFQSPFESMLAFIIIRRAWQRLEHHRGGHPTQAFLAPVQTPCGERHLSLNRPLSHAHCHLSGTFMPLNNIWRCRLQQWLVLPFLALIPLWIIQGLLPPSIQGFAISALTDGDAWPSKLKRAALQRVLN